MVKMAVGGMRLTEQSLELWGTVSFSVEGQEHPCYQHTDF